MAIARTLLLIDLSGDIDMKKKYLNCYIDIDYLDSNSLLDSSPFDDGDISIGDMIIGDDFS